jgi:hypothetical protein
MIKKIILPAASPYLTVHPQTPAARKAAGTIFRHLMGAAGRKWNSMNSTERYDLLIQEMYPGDRSKGTDAISKYSIQRWQQLPRGTKILVIALLARRAKNKKDFQQVREAHARKTVADAKRGANQ